MKNTWRGIFISALTLVGTYYSCPDAAAATVLFVPQDNRPVSFAYTVDTARDAGYQVLTPPEELLSDSGYQGSPDLLWKWLETNAGKADALVLSTDSLIYGGLVDSRKHNFSHLTLQNRLQKLVSLRHEHPQLPIYAFGTIMRSPKASGGTVEPFYYANYGPTIYEIAYWQDKKDTEGLTAAESAKLLSLTLSVPIEYLQDWFARRTKNNEINEELLQLAANGTLNYFCLGHDDTSGYSQSALESRYLESKATTLPQGVYDSFPGADQLGLLLIARYYVESHGLQPSFAVIYPLGGGASTVPHYENQPIGKTIEEHIRAVGGHVVEREIPDFLLAVNTPLTKTTGESEAFKNLSMPRKSAREFLDRVEAAMQRDIPVSIADVFYSNGSDNTLLEEMKRENLLYRVSAYNGWNTASNTVGYAIAQVILSQSMTATAKKQMLTTQYLDNWGYQANVRKAVYREQDHIRTDNVKYYGNLNRHLEEIMIEGLQNFAEENLAIDPHTISARFPWGRLFETQVYVSQNPQYPLMRDIFAQRKKAEEERLAKEKAEAEKKAKEDIKKEIQKSTSPAAPPASQKPSAPAAASTSA